MGTSQGRMFLVKAERSFKCATAGFVIALFPGYLLLCSLIVEYLFLPLVIVIDFVSFSIINTSISELCCSFFFYILLDFY